MSIPRSRQEKIRRYSPLGIIAAAIAIAVFALPSVLNLPQANPGQVLEYAPVPSDEEASPPPGGNLAALGLGSSSTLTQPEAPPPLTTSGKRSRFRCVVINGVARQTEDPLSPPCVPHFEGDNGGATYQGVTRSEINIVFYFLCTQTNDPNGGNTFSPASRGSEGQTCGQKVDLSRPPQDNDFVRTRGLRRLAVYFNNRYQTYNRNVHMHAFYSHSPPGPTGGTQCTAECQRADAAETVESLNPFAVLPYGQGGNSSTPYSEAIAQKNVLNFVGTAEPGFAQKYPGLIWAYSPAIETQTDLFGSFLCQEGVPHPVSFSGNAEDIGKKRKFGILYFQRPTNLFFRDAKNLVKERLAECGGGDPPEYAYSDFGSVGGPNMRPQHAAALQEFRNQGVTTVLFIGAQNGEFSRSAQSINWFPEWVLFGDEVNEDFVTGRYAEQSEWEHAWVVSNVTLVGRQDEQPCALAIREVDPSFPSVDLPWVCEYYDSLRQLFTGIQVAGPRLTPPSVERGFRAIPAIPSTNPQVPACYYLQKDFTCVKDAIAKWWDPEGVIRGWSGRGCFRVPEGGKRFISDKWPEVNITARQDRAKDVCNGYTSNSSFNPHQQTG